MRDDVDESAKGDHKEKVANEIRDVHREEERWGVGDFEEVFLRRRPYRRLRERIEKVVSIIFFYVVYPAPRVPWHVSLITILINHASF